MAAEKDKKPRHAVYLTDTVWGRLKDRAIIESRSAPTTASDIIEYLLESSLGDLEQIASRLSRYQPRKGEESIEMRQTRTVYVRTEVWNPVLAESKLRKFSISGLIEYLLIPYLGMERGPREAKKEQPRSIKPEASSGQITFLLGDDPFVIDPKTATGKEQ